MSGLIVREAILPRFKQSPPDYGGGIEAGADAIIKQMSLPPDQAQKNLAQAQKQQQQSHRSGGNPAPLIFWVMIIAFVILSHFRRSVGRQYRTRSGGISPWVVLWGLDALGRGSGRGLGGGGWGGGGFGGGGLAGFPEEEARLAVAEPEEAGDEANFSRGSRKNFGSNYESRTHDSGRNCYRLNAA